MMEISADRSPVVGKLILALVYCAAIFVNAETLGSTDRSSTLIRSRRRIADSIQDQYIVVYRDQPAVGTDATVDPNTGPIKAQVETLVADLGGTVQHSYSYALNGFAAKLSPEALTALLENPNIAYVQPDAIVSISTTQTQESPPWGLDRIDQKTGLDGVYTYSATGAGVHAYIIDTGISSTHSEFTGRLGNGYNAVTSGDSSPEPWDDCNFHGTHVASTVGGTNYGVAKKVTLHAVRVFDCFGTGSWSNVIAGIDWVTGQHNMKKIFKQKSVVNMSLGGGRDDTLNQAVENMVAAGVVVVVSAGNNNWDACTKSPASAANVITVGATDNTDTRASFSNWGDCVDIFAPGVNILGANFSCDTCSRLLNGTSMATPHVTGVAALYLQKIGGKPAQIASVMLAQAVDGIVNNSRTASNKLVQSTIPAKCRPTRKICRKFSCSSVINLCCCSGLKCKLGTCR